jgi:UDP-N-acetylglucosamine pyrophosphorylase
MAKKPVTLEVLRNREFAPVKNRTGEDSLETSRAMQSELHRSWLKELGVEVSGRSLIEISPLAALDKNDLAARVQSLPAKINEDMYIQ